MSSIRPTSIGAMILVLLALGNASAATLQVPQQYETIGAALTLAVAGDRVEVAPGLYLEHGLRIRDGVILAGVGTDPEQTIIDGQGRGRILSACTPGQLGRVLRLTFQNGWARGKNSYERSGGAILIQQAKIEINDCKFRNNRADGHGGAIRVLRSSPSLTRCDFIGNTALLGGGGALDCSYEASPVIEDCSFHQNFAAWGGALAIRGRSTPEIVRGDFQSNRSDGQQAYGGAVVSFFDSDPVFRYSSFYGNRSDLGGALAALPGSPVYLEHCTLTRNAADNGAAIYNQDAISAVLSCIVAFQEGPGLTTEGPNALQMGCTNVHGNSGGDLVGFAPDIGELYGNLSADPMFCSMDERGLSFNLAVESECVTDGSCGTIGAWVPACSDGQDTLPADDTPQARTIDNLQASPNPFNPSTRIHFELETAQRIVTEIYSIDGRRVRHLGDRVYPVGQNFMDWDGRDDNGRRLGSGAYLVRMHSEIETLTYKLALLK